ncbi:MAG TPA: Ig-like domain-containing protein, partial [Gemmatimonadales bacterium]|nr:Ig-like domain-containing protein [Gemmatimonadales bacterium]
MLGSRKLAKRDVAALVRRNCVTFRPTARDRADLRLAGADDAVFAAIDECLRARATAPSPAPTRPAAPARSPLRVVAPQQVSGVAGSENEVVVQLFRGTVPQAGMGLVLRGASAIPGGLTQDPVALTDQAGAATFHVLAGTMPGTYSLTVALQSGAPLRLANGGGAEIQFVTMPEAIGRAEAPTPAPPPPPPPVASVQFTQWSHGTGQHGAVGAALAEALVLEVRDQTGKPIVGEAVTFATTSGTVTPGIAVSDSSGMIRVGVKLGGRAGPVVITANVGTLIRTATVHADPGPPRALVVLNGDQPVLGGVAIRSRDTVMLRVVARDAFDNRTFLEDFSATTSGRAIALRSAEARDSVGIVKLDPRRDGAGAVDVSASGLRARVAVDVQLPPAARGAWAIGARTGALGVNTPWIDVPNLTGIRGADFSLFGRRVLTPGISLAVGGTVGSLTIDQTTGSASATLLEGYGRVELSLFPRGRLSPVVSLGAGGYRLKSGDDGRTVYHTNLFWSA